MSSEHWEKIVEFNTGEYTAQEYKHIDTGRTITIYTNNYNRVSPGESSIIEYLDNADKDFPSNEHLNIIQNYRIHHSLVNQEEDYCVLPVLKGNAISSVRVSGHFVDEKDRRLL